MYFNNELNTFFLQLSLAFYVLLDAKVKRLELP